MKTSRQKSIFRTRLHIKPQQTLIAAVLLLFLFVVAWNRPYVLPEIQIAQPTQTLTSTVAPNATPAPAAEEVEPTHEDTTGIIIGGIVLVLIVVGGTLTTILRKPYSEP